MSENLLIGLPAFICGFVALIIVDVIISVVAINVQRKDLKCYPKRAANSPTKVYHDLIGYYVFPLNIAYWCVDYVTRHIANGVGLSWSLLWWFIVPLVFYVLCVIYDCYHPASEEDIHLRHPEDWKPIWETMSERHTKKR